MFRLIYRLLTQKIYIEPYRHEDGEMPGYLSLREIADMPAHHPCVERKAGDK